MDTNICIVSSTQQTALQGLFSDLLDATSAATNPAKEEDSLVCSSTNQTRRSSTHAASILLDSLSEDAYFCLKGGAVRGTLPPIDWSGNCRKAYSLLFWMRPRLGKDQTLDGNADPTQTQTPESTYAMERYFYRFFSSTNEGVAVSCTNWKILPGGRIVETVLTARTYDASMQAGNSVSVPLQMEVDQWSLIGCSQVLPYLKRPLWTLTVNGRNAGCGDLNYPLPTSWMDNNTLLQNIVSTQGAEIVENLEPFSPDSRKSASSTRYRALEMHVASISLYPIAVSSAVQAIIAEAGVVFSTQSPMPRLPPVSNWAKGSSIEAGPKVGIPLAVHPIALNVQHVAGSLLMGISASLANKLGDGRWMIPIWTIENNTSSESPRVGLVEPTSPIRYNPDDSPVLYLSGDVEIIKCSLLALAGSEGRLEDASSSDVRRHASLCWEPLIAYSVLPYFLSLCPPAILWDRHSTLYEESIVRLHTLFSTPLSAQLIQLLARCISVGGARVIEVVLQDGILHTLSSTLRLSLLRAQKGRLWVRNNQLTSCSLDDLQSRLRLLRNEESSTLYIHSNITNNSKSGIMVCPRNIPSLVVEACCELIGICCGPPATRMEFLAPSDAIRRTSDLALTAIFGCAFDTDLWGGNVEACAAVFQTVADRYGGFCLTLGYIIRNQISVQHFLDIIRLLQANLNGSAAGGFIGNRSSTTDASAMSSNPTMDLPSHVNSNPEMINKHVTILGEVGRHQTRLVTAMLLASLSNRRSISQGEHDLGSCVNTLTDNPLGSLAAHVVLNSIVSILVWCDIFPIEATPFWSIEDLPLHNHQQSYEEHKMQVASRLGRNLLLSQFHTMMAPMILSRTVFAGDCMPNVASHHSFSSTSIGDDVRPAPLSWESHWSLTLLLYSWVASIAGSEGLSSSKSCGSLLTASGLTGSLDGALSGVEQAVVSALYLPSPGMALMVGSAILHDWSYTDLLSDRLGIMIPLLPGLVLCLTSNPMNATKETIISRRSLQVLADLFSAVGSSFHRVYGGIIHQTTGPPKAQIRNRRDKSAEIVKAAKNHVPYLFTVILFLEKHIRVRRQEEKSTKPVTFNKPDVHRERLQHIDSDAWIEVSATESVITDVTISVPAEFDSSSDSIVVLVLQDCQKSILNTVAGLISTAMSLGGDGASISVWNHVLQTMEDILPQTTNSSDLSNSPIYPDVTPKTQSAAVEDRVTIAPSNVCDKSSAKELLCRLVSIVLSKALKRHDQWEVWSYEMSSAVAKLCLMIEEKHLLKPLNGQVNSNSLADDQVLLIASVLEVLTYGRDTTGWCQLHLPPMNRIVADGITVVDVSAASKFLIPVLEPCLCLILESVGNISTLDDIEIVEVNRDDSISRTPEREKLRVTNKESLLGLVVSELAMTLTAAIVGRSFSAARDMALEAMALLRKAAARREELSDPEAAKICRGLIQTVAEELRVRYEGERRLRETALFDVYEGGGKVTGAESSTAIERLILGNDAHFDQDFVFFHEPDHSTTDQEKKRRLGYAEYAGLGAALEECKCLVDNSLSHDELTSGILAVLAPFLDAWDAVDQEDTLEIEIVPLFGTAMSASKQSSIDASQFSIPGSESAADAMSGFFEEAASEKSRFKEISFRFKPNQRSCRISFAERYCTARFAEIYPFVGEVLWERGVPDGNRDSRARIPTVPCFPQFRRYIPKYLDHYSDPDYDESDQSGDIDSSPKGLHLRHASFPDEIDAFTINLLQAGKLEIFDITKQQATDDDESELLPLRLPSESVDEDDLGIFNEVDSLEKPSSQSATEMSVRLEEDGSQEDALSPEIGHSLNDLIGKGNHNITTSSFSTPPDNSSSSLSLLHSAAATLIELHLDSCLHVRAEGSRPCTLLLTATHLILEYEGDPEGYFEGEVLAAKDDADRRKMIKDAGEYKDQSLEELFQQKIERRQRDVAALRPKSIRWNLSEVSHVYLRRYRLRDSSIELFFIPSGGSSFGGFGAFSAACTIFLDFGPGHTGSNRRDDAAFAIMHRIPPQAIKQWPDRSSQFLHDQLSRLTIGWAEGRISNMDYLLHLNILSGRSYNDICQYPVFPWVLSNYDSEEIPDLTDRNNFRDLSKPVGALNPDRLADFVERFNSFADPSIPPFMYGSHYSTSAGVVLHFLVRLHPFAGLHRQLQSGHFDVADRLFSSIPRTWSMCTGTSAAEVKELIPEFYCNPAFLKNGNNFKFGTSQDGDVIGDVVLPPWAKGSPDKFVEVMRAALESDLCSQMLPDWIDLIFGKSQQGPEAIKANNVFFYLTYYGSVDVASIQDESLRHATELQIAHFGQCPMQLFRRPHLRRIPRELRRLSFYQILSPYTSVNKSYPSNESIIARERIYGEPFVLPFFSAPLSHWVHLDAPPPGPHAALIAVRFAGADRCLAVDSMGIFHTFRWGWRSDDEPSRDAAVSTDECCDRQDFDSGCFIAQREYPRFRSVPRLMHDFATPGDDQQTIPAVAISKTLFAGRSLLLVLSDGDGCGGFGMQLLDPSKGQIRGEALVPAVHAGRISCIATDPIGTAAGHGGVGGELVVLGSLDGSASLWRFMSSQYLPLRPRVLLRGLTDSKVCAVALCSGIFLAATVTGEKCSLYSLGNGNLIRSFSPPVNSLDFAAAANTTTTANATTTPTSIIKATARFADTPALALSVCGYVVTVCETLIVHQHIPTTETVASAAPTTTTTSSCTSTRKVISLHLCSVEGVWMGSKPLESWRGLPHKMQCTPDGTAVMVCCGRGITLHRLSAIEPLEILDEWQITEADHSLGRSTSPMDAAYDIDLGPSLNRPVVAVAACSNGALRLHALPGISAWSERSKRMGLSHTVGTALAKPAQRLNRVVRTSLGLGRQLAGMGLDIGKEVSSDVKERGVSGFFGNLLKKN